MQDFSHEVAALRPVLVRVARKHLRNHAWVEDAVSETLIAALEKPGAFAGKAVLQAWLVGILKNKVVDQIRRQTRECPLEEHAGNPDHGQITAASADGVAQGPVDWGDPMDSIEQRQFMMQFNRCLKLLPLQQGRAFLLRNCMDRDPDDICDELGVNANHLRVLLHRARIRLRASLQAQWAPFGQPARVRSQA